MIRVNGHMSTDEKERIVGKTLLDLKKQRCDLACLERKRDIMAEQIRHAADRLYEPVCYSPESLMYDLPSREERCGIVNEIKAAGEQVEELASNLKKMTGE